MAPIQTLKQMHGMDKYAKESTQLECVQVTWLIKWWVDKQFSSWTFSLWTTAMQG